MSDVSMQSVLTGGVADTRPIPRLLHYCWFGGGRKSDTILRCMDTWQQHFADWEIVEWNEENTPTDLPYCEAALASGQWAMIADYARLLALYTHGGVYLDTDVDVRRSFEPLRAHECFLGFQAKPEQDDWVNNAVIGARPEHGFVGECLSFTLTYFERFGEFARSPAVTTHVLRERGLRSYGAQLLDDIMLLPVEAFYPFHWNEQYSDVCVTAETYSVHHWEGSWRS